MPDDTGNFLSVAAWAQDGTGGPALDVDSVLGFLVDREIVALDAILDGEVVVDAAPRRNRNLRVTLANGGGVFIKQPEETSSLNRVTLRAEGDFYRCRADGPWAAALPGLVLYEPDRPILVLELLGGHRTLAGHCLARPSHEFPIHVWRQLGELLGSLHRNLQLDRSERDGWIGRALAFHRPNPAQFATISPGGLEVLKILQSSVAISDGLDEVCDGWCSDTAVHGDLRAENILIGPGQDGGADLRLIDWESCQMGDAAWDIAGILALGTALALHGEFPAEMNHDMDAPWTTGLPMATFQICNRTFWKAYGTARCLSAADLGPLAHKAALHTAARLVQSTMELTMRSDQLPDTAVDLLQVSENIFNDPPRAVTELFAID